MKKRIFLIALAAVMAASCSKKPDVPATAETTAAVQTEAAANIKAESEAESVAEAVEEAAETAAEEAAEAVAEAVENALSGEKTNGKPVITKDTEIFEGIKIGMKADELKAVLGEPENDIDIEDMYAVTYGENTFMFTGEEGQDKVLTMAYANGSFAGKLTNGIEFSCSKQDVIDAFCCDLEDNTPDEVKEEGERLLYGRDAYEVLDKLDKGEKLDVKGEYNLGFESDDMDGLAYMSMTADGKYMVYVVMYQFDSEGKLDSVSMMLTDDEEFTGLFGGSDPESGDAEGSGDVDE